MKMRSSQITIARIGGELSYSGLATRELFGATARVLQLDTFDECLQKVRDTKADVAVVPIHNTINKLICGNDNVTPVIEIADSLGLKNIHKLVFKVDHILASYGKLEGIRVAYSKSEPLGQCSKFLKRHGITPTSSISRSLIITDTATAAKYVSRHQFPYTAAICNKEAAEHYGIPIVRGDIANVKDNKTEFHVYQRRDDPRDISINVDDYTHELKFV